MALQIEHTGVIKNIQPNLIQVLIIQNSACGDCDANGACIVSDQQEKIIDIASSDTTFKTGEQVIITGRQSIGLLAVLLAFVVPFVLILITLVILHSLIINEAISGIASVLILVPYYIILSFFKNKLKAKFKFDIRKVITD
jgi:sigma-E factor negative regulatory protein RseC